MSGAAAGKRRFGWKHALLLVLAGLAVLIAANAHLVMVAFESRPDCVPHSRDVGQDGTYRAARSAC